MGSFKMDKQKYRYLLGILVFVIVMATLTFVLTPAIIHITKDPQNFSDFLATYGSLSILTFIAFQILQVVIAAIPGEFVQIAGGYIFGIFWGTVYSVIGILIGAMIAFFVARLLGKKMVYKLLPEKSLDRFTFLMNTRKSELIIFLLFLIPGLPKDILVYVAGLSPIRPLRFFSIYTIARMPGLIGSSIIGANLQDKNYFVAVLVFAVSCVLFLIGYFARDVIMHRLKASHDQTVL